MPLLLALIACAEVEAPAAPAVPVVDWVEVRCIDGSATLPEDSHLVSVIGCADDMGCASDKMEGYNYAPESGHVGLFCKTTADYVLVTWIEQP